VNGCAVATQNIDIIPRYKHRYPTGKLPADAMDLPPQMMPLSLQINGRSHDRSLDTRTTLLDTLRWHLQLAGT